MDLSKLTITSILEGYKTKKFSVSEIVNAYLEQIEKLNPTLNAFITIDGETCILLGVTRESGSGNSFILEYYSNGTKQTKCVRTID